MPFFADSSIRLLSRSCVYFKRSFSIAERVLAAISLSSAKLALAVFCLVCSRNEASFCSCSSRSTLARVARKSDAVNLRPPEGLAPSITLCTWLLSLSRLCFSTCRLTSNFSLSCSLTCAEISTLILGVMSISSLPNISFRIFSSCLSASFLTVTEKLKFPRSAIIN